MILVTMVALGGVFREAEPLLVSPKVASADQHLDHMATEIVGMHLEVVPVLTDSQSKGFRLEFRSTDAGANGTVLIGLVLIHSLLTHIIYVSQVHM